MSSESWLLVKTHGWKARLISIYSWYNFLYGCAGVCQQELLLWEGSMWVDGPGDGHLEVKQTISPQLSLQLKVLQGRAFGKRALLLVLYLLLLLFSFCYSSFLSSSYSFLLGSDEENRNTWALFSFSLCLEQPHSDLYADDCLFLLGSSCKASSHQANVLHLCSVYFEEEPALCWLSWSKKSSSVNSSSCLRGYSWALSFADTKLLGSSPTSPGSMSYFWCFGL